MFQKKTASVVIGGALLVASGLFASMPAAAAGIPCGERDVVVESLKQRFNEIPQAKGLVSNSELFELFVSPARTWTILVTSPQGVSCVVAAGDEWDRAPVEVALQPEPF